VRRYERPVRGLIRRIVHDPALAEDLAQDTFVKVYRHLPRFDVHRPLTSWIFRIAHHTAVDALRRRRAEGPLVEAAPVVDPAPPECDRLALARALEAALAGLRVDQRVALLLRYQEGLSYEEIGAVLGVPEGTAKTLVHRGRRTMAAALEAAGWRP
jgi:RNA polymerase sigma-70 factor (ECF subfamily)